MRKAQPQTPPSAFQSCLWLAFAYVADAILLNIIARDVISFELTVPEIFREFPKKLTGIAKC